MDTKPDDMVIFARTFDLLDWLLQRCDSFPGRQRRAVATRLQNAALDFQEAIFDANAHTSASRLAFLLTADAHLNKVRLYLRLAHHWRWLSSGQYEHASRMVAEIGKLLGGWLKQTQSSLKSH